MNWNEYVSKAITTMAFRNNEVAETCCLLGMCGELAEYKHKLQYTNCDAEDLLKELGDVYWYVAVFWHLHKFEAEPVSYENYNTDPFLGIGMLQETMKKIYRKKQYDETNDQESGLIYRLLSEIYTYLCYEGGKLNTSPERIWEMNIDKLFDRKDRGVLHSSGDNR